VQPNVTARDSQSNCLAGELARHSGAPGKTTISSDDGNDPPFFHPDASAPSSILAAQINIQTGVEGLLQDNAIRNYSNPTHPEKSYQSRLILRR